VLFYLGVANLMVEDGKITKEYKPYFYTTEKPDGLEYENLGAMNWYIRKGAFYEARAMRTFKVYVNKPSEVKKFRSKFSYVSQSYIKYAARIAIDQSANPKNLLREDVENLLTTPPRFVVYDIEKKGSTVFLGYSAGDEVVVERYSTVEPSSLRQLSLFYQRFDYLAGYNNWDYDYRVFKSLNIKPNPILTKYAMETAYGIKPVLDLYVIASGRFSASFGVTIKSLQLVDVLFNLGLARSEELAYKAVRSNIANLTDAEIKDYLKIDVEHTYRLAKAWVPLMEALGKLYHTNAMVINQVAETASPGLMNELLIHKFMEYQDTFIQDTERDFDVPKQEKSRLRHPGLYKNVLELDFSAMYPSILYQYKVDPLGVKPCVDGDVVRIILGKKPESYRVCFEDKGVNTVFKHFFQLRQKTKELKKTGNELPDMAVKIAANSAYGIMGKSGVGIISPLAFSFVFEKSSSMHKDIFEKFNAVYGDTDSIFIPNIKQDEVPKIEDEVNNYVKGKYGEVFSLKAEGYWDHVLLPVMKNYIKVAGDRVVVKGVVMKPSQLPFVFRYSYDIYKYYGESAVKKINEVVEESDPKDLFIEYSATLAELLLSREGKLIKSIGVKRSRILAWLATCLGGNIDVLMDTGAGELVINGTEVNPNVIIDVRVLPIREAGDKKLYLSYCPNKHKVLQSTVTIRCGRLKPTVGKCQVQVISTREANPEDVKQVALQYIFNLPFFKYLVSLT